MITDTPGWISPLLPLANDLNGICVCGECASVLDGLVAADGTTGEMPDLAGSIASDGAQVMLVGYKETSPDAGFGFEQCGDGMAEISAPGRN